MFTLSLISVGFADTVAENASGKISVTDVIIDPKILISGDVGMVTVKVTNTGTSNVIINDAMLISSDVTILNSDTYNSVRTIGGGTSMDFTFTILANQPEGIYYPAFYLDYRDAGSLRYNIPIRIESPELSLSAIQIPDTFIPGANNGITLLIGNPKSVEITGIKITPKGNGLTFNQTSFFIGELSSHNATRIGFLVNPSVPTNLTFDVNYTCGMNTHFTSFSLPIKFGLDKKAADPVISNLQIAYDASGRRLSGDISNAGLKDAYGVIVSLQDESLQTQQNLNYVVGSIQSDDFSSFEITVPREVTSTEITLLVQYKDESGNPFTKTMTVDIDKLSITSLRSGTSGSSGSNARATGGNAATGGFGGGTGNPIGSIGRGMNNIPVEPIVVGILIIVALIIGWRLIKRRKRSRKKTETSK